MNSEFYNIGGNIAIGLAGASILAVIAYGIHNTIVTHKKLNALEERIKKISNLDDIIAVYNELESFSNISKKDIKRYYSIKSELEKQLTPYIKEEMLASLPTITPSSFEELSPQKLSPIYSSLYSSLDE